MAADLVQLKEIDPEAAAYELGPGKVYLIMIQGPDVDSGMLGKIQHLLKSRGVSAVVLGGEADVQIFGLETGDGAAVALRDAREARDGPDLG